LNSGNLKEFSREMLDRGYREFIVDLAGCAMMDSTFMGTMASVALRLKELGHGHLHIVHCGNRSQQLLSGLGLDQIFDIHGNGASAPECAALEQATKEQSSNSRKMDQTETMLQAHEALCQAAPENIFRFKDVLDFLRQDLHHETSSKYAGPAMSPPLFPGLLAVSVARAGVPAHLPQPRSPKLGRRHDAIQVQAMPALGF